MEESSVYTENIEYTELKKSISVKRVGRVGRIDFCGEGATLGSDECYTLVLAEHGDMTLTGDVNAEIGERRIFILKKGVTATLCSTVKARAFLLEFDYKSAQVTSLPERAIRARDYRFALLMSIASACEDLFGILTEYKSRLSRADALPASGQIIKNSLELLLIDAVSTSAGAIKTQKELFFKKGAAGALAAKNIYEYLLAHADENVSLDEIAGELFFSKSYVKTVFKKYTNKTIIQALAEIKAERAKKLLGEGKSVKETAERLSYCNAAYFAAAFKKVTGVTPTEYRNSLGL